MFSMHFVIMQAHTNLSLDSKTPIWKPKTHVSTWAFFHQKIFSNAAPSPQKNPTHTHKHGQYSLELQFKTLKL